MKRYYIGIGIGKAKYTVSFHNGEKKHADGSDFWDIAIFNTRFAVTVFTAELFSEGYREI